MIDVTVIGGGASARACTDLLSAAGFGLRRTFDFDDQDRSPIILGEVPAAITIARHAVNAGRHLLIANPSQFSPERLGLLYEGRRKAQSLFLWSTRRYHPGYRFVSSLIQADATWQPRYVRHETLLTDAPAPGITNWTLAESAAVVIGLAGEPIRVSAAAASNPMRNANELMALAIDFPELTAFIEAGLGEPIERHETLIAGAGRKAFIDELDETAPVKLIADDRSAQDAASTRYVSAPAPSFEEGVRQQCLAFLDATVHPEQAHDEANLWTSTFAVIVAARESLAGGGAGIAVEPRLGEAPGPRLMFSA